MPGIQPVIREVVGVVMDPATRIATATTASTTKVGDWLVAIASHDWGKYSQFPNPGGTAGTWRRHAVGNNGATGIPPDVTYTDNGGNQVHNGIWTRKVTGTGAFGTNAGAQTVTSSGAGTNSDVTLMVLVIDGSTVDAAEPVDVVPIPFGSPNGGQAAVTSHVAPSVDPADDGLDGLLITVHSIQGPGSAARTYTTIPPGMTQRGTQLNSRNFVTQLVCTQVLDGGTPDAPTGTRTATASANTGYAAAAIALKGRAAASTAQTINAGSRASTDVAGTPAVGPLTSGRRSDFSTDPVDALPISYGAELVGGRLRINAINAGTGGTTYSGRKSAEQPNGRDVFDDLFFEVTAVPAADPGGAASPGMAWVQAASQPAGTRVGWEYDPRNGQLYARSQVGYVNQAQTGLTYDPAVHRWWRVRRDGDLLRWETSAAARPTAPADWTSRASIAAPAWLYLGGAGISLEAYRTGGETDFFELDNLNVVTTASPQSLSVGPRASTAVAGTPTLTRGAVSRTLIGRTSAAVAGEPTVTRGTVSRSPLGRASTDVAGVPAVTQGPVSRTPAGRTSTATGGEPTLTVGPAVARPLGRSTAARTGTPTLTRGAVLRVPLGRDSTAATGRAALLAGVVARTPAGRPSTATTGEVGGGPGPIDRTPAGRPSSASIGGPAVTVGEVSRAPAGRPSSATTGAPALAPGPVTRTPAARPTAATRGTPSLTRGPVARALVGRPAARTTGTPSIERGTVVRVPLGRASTAAGGSPTLGTGTLVLVTEGRTSTATTGEPTALVGPVSRTPAGRSSTTTTGQPGINQTILAGARPSSRSSGRPTLGRGAIERTVEGRPSELSVGEPALGIGGSDLVIAGRPAETATGDPTLELGTVVREVDPRPSETVTGEPELYVGEVTRTPSGRSSTHTTGRPSRHVGRITRTPEPREAEHTTGEPDLERGWIARTPAARPSSRSTGRLVLLVGPITREMAGVPPSEGVGAPRLKLGRIELHPEPADSLLTLGEPLVVLGAAVVITPGRLGVTDRPGGLAVRSRPRRSLSVTSDEPNRIEVFDGWP